MRLVSAAGSPEKLQLAIENPEDEARLLAALEVAQELATELRGGAGITSEELYTRLGLSEFRSPEGDAPMRVVAFKLLMPFLYPEYSVTNSINRAEGYDYWTAPSAGGLVAQYPERWCMQEVVGSRVLVGA